MTLRDEKGVYTYGMQNYEKRKRTFQSRADTSKKMASEVVRKAIIAQRHYLKQTEKYEALAKRLEKLHDKALEESKELMDKGLARIDGKRAKALIDRGLADTCGLVEAKTLLHCTNDVVELQSMYWAEEWVVDLLKDLGTKITPSEMSKFYDKIKKYKGEPKTIVGEAGLIILGKM